MRTVTRVTMVIETLHPAVFLIPRTLHFMKGALASAKSPAIRPGSDVIDGISPVDNAA